MKKRLKLIMLLVILGAAKAEAYDVTDYTDSFGPGTLRYGLNLPSSIIEFQVSPAGPESTYAIFTFNGPLAPIGEDLQLTTNQPAIEDRVTIEWDNVSSGSYLLNTYYNGGPDSPWLEISSNIHFDAQGASGANEIYGIIGEDDLRFNGGLGSDVTVSTTNGGDGAVGLFAEDDLSFEANSAASPVDGSFFGSLDVTSAGSLAAGMIGEENVSFEHDLGGEISVKAFEDGAFGVWAEDGSVMVGNDVTGDITVEAVGEDAFGILAGEDIEIDGNLGGTFDIDAGEDYAFGLAAGWYGGGSHIEIGEDVTSTFNVTAGGMYAYGMYADDYIDIGRDLGGTFTIEAGGSAAYGLRAHEHISIGEDVTSTFNVTADGYAAYGMYADDYIDIGRDLGGTFTIEAGNYSAYGLRAWDEDINIGEDVTATMNVTAGEDSAFGLRAGEDIVIGGDLGGTFTIDAGEDNAFGLAAGWGTRNSSRIDIDGDVTGSYTVTAGGDDAYGMFATDYIDIGGSLGGSFTIEAGDYDAFGLRTWDGDIEIDENVTATMNVTAGEDNAFGLLAGEDIVIGGDLGGTFTIDAGEDNAFGLAAGWDGGGSHIDIGGDVTGSYTVTAGGDNAYGMFANDYIDIGGSLGGDFTIEAGDYNAYGLRADEYISIGEDVTSTMNVTAGISNAYGLRAFDDIDIGGSLGGSFTIESTAGSSAYGLRADMENIEIGEDVTSVMNVTAGEHNAFGLRAGEDIEIGGSLGGSFDIDAGEDNAFGLAAGWGTPTSHIEIDGDVTSTVDVYAGGDNAYGMYANDHIEIGGTLGGDFTVEAEGSNAYGLRSMDEDIEIGEDMTGTFTVTAGENSAYGLGAGSDIEIEGDVGEDMTMTVTATDGSEAFGFRAGEEIEIGGNFDGDVTVMAGGEDAFGMFADEDIVIGGSLGGSFDIDAGEDNAYGLGAYSNIEIDGNVGEDMTMSVTATEGDSAYGFRAGEDIIIGGDFDGDVTVSAGDENAFGMRAGEDIEIGGSLGGSFDIDAGEDNAFGLAAGWGTPSSHIEIDGDVSSTVDVYAGGYNAYGMYANDHIEIGGTLGGDFTVEAEGYNAYGLRSMNEHIEVGEDMTGSFTVTAGESNAYGLRADTNIEILGDVGEDMTMSVTAGEHNAYGLRADTGIDIDGSLGGSFTVEATAGSNAYGLRANEEHIEIGEDVTSTMNVTAGEYNAFGLSAGEDIVIGGNLGGTFTIDAGEDNAFALAAGWDGGGSHIDIGGDVTGSYTVTAGGDNALGMYANDYIDIGGTLGGDFTVEAGDYNAYGLGAREYISIGEDVTATMSVTAGMDNAYGLRADEDITIGYLPDQDHDWPGTGSYLGTMNITSYGDNAFGMSAGEDIEIGNNLGGEITVTAGEDYAFGLAAGWDGGSHIEIGNDVSTDMTVTAERDYAYGMYAEDHIKTGRDLGGTITVQALDNGAYGLSSGEYIKIGRDVTTDMTVIAGNGSIGEGGVRTVGDQLVDGGDNDDAYGLRADGYIDIERNLDGTLNVWALDDRAYGLDSGEDINIGNDLSATINVTAGFEEADSDGAYGLRAYDNILIGDLSEAGIGDFTGSLTVTAYGSRAYGMQAGEDIRLGGTLSGEITTIAKDSWSVGMSAGGSIYGGGDPLENPFTIEDGTISSTAEGIDGVAMGVFAYDGMNLRIGGGSEISAVSEDGEAYAIRSSYIDFNPADDIVLLEDTASLTGNVFLGAGEDEMTVKDVAKIDTVPVLDGGTNVNNPGDPEADILSFDGWAGTLGDEVVNWETIDVKNNSIVDLGNSKTDADLDDDAEFAAIKTFADGEFVTFNVEEGSRVIAQGASPGEYVIVGDYNNDGILDLLDDEVNDWVHVTGDYTSDTGQLWLDADLSTSGKVSDERLIVGEDVIGQTTVVLNNVVSDVALTEGDGIEFVTVGGDFEPDSFVLGNPNDFGPFAVELAQGAENDNWYFQSPGYREEAAVLQSVTPFINRLGNESMMRFFERRAYGWFRDDVGEKESWWIRTKGSKYRLGLEGDAATEIDGYSGWFQIGTDLVADGDEEGTRFDLGIFAGAGFGEADVKGLRSDDKAGELSQTAYGVGAYMSLHERGTWYLDAIGQAIYNDLTIDYLTEEKQKPEVWSYAASIETGACIPLGPGFRFEPQAQLIYQYTEGIDLSTLVGDVSIEDHDGLQGRLSLAGVVGKCENKVHPFFEVTVIRDFSDDNKVRYLDDSVELTSNPEKWFLGGTIGLSQELSENNDFGYYLKGSAMFGMEDLDSYDYSIMAGLRKTF